jgi:predicted acylesterase/phospholipase RssA
MGEGAINGDGSLKAASVGIAISGGGYRATAWGLGAVAGVVRALELDKEHSERMSVVSVASVSGGSIANAALAIQFPNGFEGLTLDAYLKKIKSAVRHVAFDGLIRYASVTNTFVTVTFSVLVFALAATSSVVGSVVAVHRSWPSSHKFVIFDHSVTMNAHLFWALVAGVSVFALFEIVFSIFVRKVHPAERFFLALALLGVGCGYGTGAALVADHARGQVWRVLGIAVFALILWTVAVRLLSWRGTKVERALDKKILKPDATKKLKDIKSPVHHVFCATELQSGNHFFMSAKMLYGYDLGWRSDPGSWSIARAVQGSAALPGGFPPQRTTFASRTPTPAVESPDTDRDRVVLVDGGVYDNMATEWEIGFPNRLDHLGTHLTSAQKKGADFLIVANAGKSLEWKRIWPSLRVKREISGITRDQSIQYDQTTASRRRSLVAMFRAAEKGALGLPRGVVVQPSKSPLQVANDVAENETEPEKQGRAEEWVTRL